MQYGDLVQFQQSATQGGIIESGTQLADIKLKKLATHTAPRRLSGRCSPAMLTSPDQQCGDCAAPPELRLHLRLCAVLMTAPRHRRATSTSPPPSGSDDGSAASCSRSSPRSAATSSCSSSPPRSAAPSSRRPSRSATPRRRRPRTCATRRRHQVLGPASSRPQALPLGNVREIIELAFQSSSEARQAAAIFYKPV